ncbi:hypothetical protein [Streptomyces sp. ME18-1-4]|uniref:hypothetical protein n=1 Tax=Streptomyces sp. ME18-1-4 TaxID=3028685 RepID=UPI0029A2A03E|nr:hypothetical protein [Streptomyces sp. ME18-1-4]MDX3243598.1 hypothetical protein [Streptomyces sp. ME18-1-4]
MSDSTAEAKPETDERAKNREEVTDRLLVWFLYGVIFGLAPIWLTLTKLIWKADFHPGDIVEHGDLFLFSTILLAGAIGEMVSAGKKKSKKSTFLNALTLLCFAGNLALYLTIEEMTRDEIVYTSLVASILATILSGFNIGMAASK